MAKAAPKPPTKTEVFANIAEKTDLTKRQVASVFEALSEEIEKSLVGRNAPKTFTLHGLCKIVVQHKPAKPARKNVPNPFRPGETMDVAAKPAKNVVKIRPLKRLKDMVG
ncbi:HU family DNA-binding protein [Aeoliella sp. ICT_H6.2]|uniref:Viral histone-like protein n=1 Tax=Aeoliella straminimaris TaxID=2954799 RepID=A0A9X2FJ70_9BACT|nr:HU family DNA-binding protein [Aeoliella straminimaris]MCO6047931.1 HU family DNA-binding protein [Aeoliella straminimaris]